MAKSTFMYWQKRFNRENPDKDMEEKILELRSVHKDYGYRMQNFVIKVILLIKRKFNVSFKN